MILKKDALKMASIYTTTLPE